MTGTIKMLFQTILGSDLHGYYVLNADHSVVEYIDRDTAHNSDSRSLSEFCDDLFEKKILPYLKENKKIYFHDQQSADDIYDAYIQRVDNSDQEFIFTRITTTE